MLIAGHVVKFALQKTHDICVRDLNAIAYLISMLASLKPSQVHAIELTFLFSDTLRMRVARVSSVQ